MILETTLESVVKRDGRVVPFDPFRISQAVGRAMEASGEGELPQDADFIAGCVIEHLQRKGTKTPHIEEIQDAVEAELIKWQHVKTAKNYILYRDAHARMRKESREIPEHVRGLVEASKEILNDPLREFVHYSTYAKWMEGEKRRETWIETVNRYMTFMRETLGDKLSQEEYAEVFVAIRDQDVFPSMRLMWSAGDAARKCNASAYNCAFLGLDSFSSFAELMYLLMSGCGVGFSVESQFTQQLPIVHRQTGLKEPNLYIVEDSREGWCKALLAGFDCWYAGRDTEFDYSELRGAGERLKTMGGRSAGPEPLRQVLDFARETILKFQGRRLSNIACHDIACKIGVVVEMGGVRRAAEISLSDLDDKEMQQAKDGHFYIYHPERTAANNSAVYWDKPSDEVFLDEWVALIKSKSGERGIFNRGGLWNQLPSRRLRMNEHCMETIGLNPCVVEQTWIHTTEGPRRVRDLVDRPFTAFVDGEPFNCPSGFFETGFKDVFHVKTNHGFELRATPDHPVLTLVFKSQKTTRTEWKTVGELSVGDRIILHDQYEAQWKGNGTHLEGWLLGNVLGDGNIEKNGYANLDYWGETAEVMALSAESVIDMSGLDRQATQTWQHNGQRRIRSKSVGELAEAYGMVNQEKCVTDEIEEASSDFCEGFLSGWFDADGSVQGNLEKGVSVRLSSSSLENLKSAQRMLARLGIISQVYEGRKEAGYALMPNGRGGSDWYWCSDSHELVVSKDNIVIFAERVNFSDPIKNARLERLISSYRRAFNRERFFTTVTSIEEAGQKIVYDCQIDTANAFDANGLYVHNCGEIYLRPRQFCNLSNVVARAEDTLDTLKHKVRIAAILGTYQASLTSFKFISPEWEKNSKEEALLGVAVQGQWDCPAFRSSQARRLLKSIAVETNQEYAKRFGINPATAVTCVKPDGNSSQLSGAASGMHPRYSKFYIRRIRINVTDPLFKMMKDQGWPMNPEVGQSPEEATTFVVDFPVKSPDGAITKDDLSAISQLEYWREVKEEFTEHNPSMTCYVSDNEWLDVAQWVFAHWEIVGGLSFLPRSDTVYKLAPYEEISEDQYNEMVAKLPRIDFSNILRYELEDQTTGATALACVGDRCEI